MLVLSSQLGQTPWAYLGSWNFAETDLRGPLAHRSEAEQIDALTHRYELSAGAARSLLLRERFTSWPTPQPSEYVTEQWASCAAQDEPGAFLCPINRELRNGLELESVLVRMDAPAQSHMRLLNRFPPARGSKTLDGRPALVLIASESCLSATAPSGAGSTEVLSYDWLGLLFDVVHQRVLVGSPAILQSTFTQLMYLHGRYSSRFRSFQDHVGFADKPCPRLCHRLESLAQHRSVCGRPGVELQLCDGDLRAVL